MRGGILSAGLLFPRRTGREQVGPDQRSPWQAGRWNPEDFAREQIRGLVRQIFFSNVEKPVRQVVFSTLEPQTDVWNICRRVGEALAMETEQSIAVVGAHPHILPDAETDPEMPEETGTNGSTARKQGATRVRSNLWLVSPAEKHRDRVTTTFWHSYLGEMRREFGYSIVEGPPAKYSNETTAMAQFADGIVLVLSAHRTRRVMARKVKETLEGAQARIFGVLLIDRVFPIPEGIYRRL
jgi:hypothetical protein